MSDEVKKSAQVYSLHGVGEAVRKLDNPSSMQAVQGNAFEPEDEYQQLYVGATRDVGIIQPPYVLRTLNRLSQENNTLGPCIEAMVTNVAGTGYKFVSKDDTSEDTEDGASINKLEEFFKEPWPGVSFTSIREDLRRDMERNGNAYLEVLRNPQDEIVFFRRVDSAMMRLLRLDDPVPIEQKVVRDGKEVTIKVMTRERRYCQLVNGVSLMYFKEFGATRDLNKKSAVWSKLGERLPANQRATEIIHFTLLPDAHTPYGVPRWITQVPSVLGSRKAEEFNLEFFDNGGIPPIMIILQGGMLQAETRRRIEQMTSGAAKKNNRVQVLEVEPAGGSLDSTPQARVTVERFGSDRQQDSMFEKYDERCEQRVRRAFRLPPIFLGQAADYSFATAYASYTVAEAQVFKPERDEEDDFFTMRLLPAMGFRDYKMVSNGLTIEDATLKLQGLDFVGTAPQLQNQIEPADLIEELNLATGLKLKVSESALDLKAQMDQQQKEKDAEKEALANQPQPPTPIPGTTSHIVDHGSGKVTPIRPGKGVQLTAGKPTGTVMSGGLKKADGLEIAHEMLTAMRKRDFETLAKSLEAFNALDPDSQERVMEAARDLQFVDPSLDPEGLSELSSYTVSAMGCRHHDH